MISNEEIIQLGFTKVDAWSTDVTDSYQYIKNRYDKPRNTINLYRIDRLINTDYFEIVSSLQRETDFYLRTYSYNGDIYEIDDLFDLFEQLKDLNAKV